MEHINIIFEFNINCYEPTNLYSSLSLDCHHGSNYYTFAGFNFYHGEKYSYFQLNITGNPYAFIHDYHDNAT